MKLSLFKKMSDSTINKISIILILIFIFSTISLLMVDNLSGELPDVQKRAVISCKSPIYNFGTIEYEKTIEHKFVIKNSGKLPLKIEEINTPCCTKLINKPELIINPNEETELLLKMKAMKLNGVIKSQTLVKSNDSKTPILTLEFNGKISSPVSLSKDLVLFRDVNYNAFATSSIMINKIDNFPLNIKKIDVSSPYFRVESKKTGKNNIKILISTIPPLPPSVTSAFVNLITDSNKYKRITFNIMAYVTHLVSVAPGEIIYTRLSSVPSTSYIRVSPDLVRNFKITGVKLPFKNQRYFMKEINNNVFLIMIKNVMFNKALDGKYVIIETSLKKLPLIKIPFKYISEEEKSLN